MEVEWEHGTLHLSQPEQGWDLLQMYANPPMTAKGDSSVLAIKGFERVFATQIKKELGTGMQGLYDTKTDVKLFDKPIRGLKDNINAYKDLDQYWEAIRRYRPISDLQTVQMKNPLLDPVSVLIGAGNSYDVCSGRGTAGQVAQKNLIEGMNQHLGYHTSDYPNTVLDFNNRIFEYIDSICEDEEQETIMEHFSESDVIYFPKVSGKGEKTTRSHRAMTNPREMMHEFFSVTVAKKGSEHAAAKSRAIITATPVLKGFQYACNKRYHDISVQAPNLVIHTGGEERKQEVERLCHFMEVSNDSEDRIMDAWSIDLTKYNECINVMQSGYQEVSQFYGKIPTSELALYFFAKWSWFAKAVKMSASFASSNQKFRRHSWEEILKYHEDGKLVFNDPELKTAFEACYPYMDKKGNISKITKMLMGWMNEEMTLEVDLATQYSLAAASQKVFGKQAIVSQNTTSSDDIALVTNTPRTSEDVTDKKQSLRIIKIYTNKMVDLAWVLSLKKTFIAHKVPVLEYNSCVYTDKGQVAETNFHVSGMGSKGEAMQTDQQHIKATLQMIAPKVAPIAYLAAAQFMVDDFRYLYGLPALSKYKSLRGEHKRLANRVISKGFTPFDAPLSLGGNCSFMLTNVGTPDFLIRFQRLKHQGKFALANALMNHKSPFTSFENYGVANSKSGKKIIENRDSICLFDQNERPASKSIRNRGHEVAMENFSALTRICFSVVDPLSEARPMSGEITVKELLFNSLQVLRMKKDKKKQNKRKVVEEEEPVASTSGESEFKKRRV